MDNECLVELAKLMDLRITKLVLNLGKQPISVPGTPTEDMYFTDLAPPPDPDYTILKGLQTRAIVTWGVSHSTRDEEELARLSRNIASMADPDGPKYRSNHTRRLYWWNGGTSGTGGTNLPVANLEAWEPGGGDVYRRLFFDCDGFA
jgi:hypothetical protein